MAPAPGAYSVMSSDFDRNKLSIHRQRRMHRGGSAGAMSFASTDPRFKAAPDDQGPGSLAQFPTDMAYQLDRQRAAGSFARGAERFETSRPRRQLQPQPKDLFERAGAPPARLPAPVKLRPRYTHAFASRATRFKTPQVSPGPGFYRLPEVWNRLTGAPSMAPACTPVVNKKAPPEILPGPGAYEVSGSLFLGKGAWRQADSLGRGPQRFKDQQADGPSPGQYDISGSLLKPSFNVLLTRDES
jgi:hypothetical protein